jgi:hypothetical protein
MYVLRVNNKLIVLDYIAFFCTDKTRCQFLRCEEWALHVSAITKGMIARSGPSDCFIAFRRSPPARNPNGHSYLASDGLQDSRKHFQPVFEKRSHRMRFEYCCLFGFDKLRKCEIVRQHFAKIAGCKARFWLRLLAQHSLNSLGNGTFLNGHYRPFQNGTREASGGNGVNRLVRTHVAKRRSHGPIEAIGGATHFTNDWRVSAFHGAVNVRPKMCIKYRKNASARRALVYLCTTDTFSPQKVSAF